jgi:hypothetical protein
MPRKAQKKQTRLAFATAPAAPSGDGNEDDGERFRTLCYGHPSLASVRPERSRKSKPESPEKSSSKLPKRDKHPKLNKETEEGLPKSLKQESCTYSDQLLVIANILQAIPETNRYEKHNRRYKFWTILPMTKYLFPAPRKEKEVPRSTLKQPTPQVPPSLPAPRIRRNPGVVRLHLSSPSSQWKHLAHVAS